MALSTKQRVFVEHYVRCFNATEAARRAGYSAKTAYSIGQENLKKPEVKAAIDARLAELTMSPTEILTTLTEQARSDMADFLTGDNLDLKKAERLGKLALVKSYAVSDKGAIRIELYDKQAALVQLGRYHGLFVDKQEVAARVEFTADDANQAERELDGWQPDHAAG
jgi:phage terminase small subunit